MDTSALRHDIKLVADLEPGDHVWQRGIVEAVFPQSKRVMHVVFADGERLAYDPRERVLCDVDE